ncbi:DUF5723 family protein [Saprospira grandis]|uniref:DUF5723 family protein n=1 Tax=Saprospira grandis TaxID=1008 RepID=UPI0022DDA64C|nr:DUF5723 family protein [Saprospira grandis]WBM75890.1 DUF5723 family protein [Saprospira grandis]
MKTILPFLGLFFLSLTLWAQPSTGYHASNYAGIQSISVNPANIVNSRFRQDINLFSFDVNISNNYLGLNTSMFNLSKLKNPLFDSTYSGNFQLFRDQQLREKPKDEARMYQEGYTLGPSIGFEVGRHSFAVTTALRQYFHIDNLDQDMAQMILSELENPSLQNININNGKFQALAGFWTEIGLAYGQEVWKKGEHRLKVAAHLKLPIGGFSSYFYADTLVVNFPNEDTLNVLASNVRFGYSNNWQDFTTVQGNDTVRQSAFDGAAALLNQVGFNADLGVIYEWHPKEKSPIPGIRDDQQYKLKVGLSILDLGVVNFKRGTYGANFSDVAVNWPIDSMNFDGVPDFGRIMRDSFNMEETNDAYQLRLPTSMNIQVDYHVFSRLFVNMSGHFAFASGGAPLKLHDLSQWSVSTRWEHKWYELALPFAIDGYNNFNAGFAFRAGPLYLGSSNVWNFLLGNYVHGLNVYGGLRVPLFKKPSSEPPTVSQLGWKERTPSLLAQQVD